jgi:hypothetical protein
VLPFGHDPDVSKFVSRAKSILRDKKNVSAKYSKTPIYRASRGKGDKPGKSGDTVNRGTGKIDQNSTYLRFKMINFAMQLHSLVYASTRLT